MPDFGLDHHLRYLLAPARCGVVVAAGFSGKAAGKASPRYPDREACPVIEQSAALGAPAGACALFNNV